VSLLGLRKSPLARSPWASGDIAARGDANHYAAEQARERYEVEKLPEREAAEVRDIFAGFGLAGAALETVVEAVTSDKTRWVDFMMRKRRFRDDRRRWRA
jgi:hypothetical protein